MITVIHRFNSYLMRLAADHWWKNIGKWLPWLVLAISLATTYQLWESEQRDAKNNLQTKFDFRVREVSAKLKQNVDIYEQMLSGVQSLYAASVSVERNEFHDYVLTLELAKNHPGVKALGFAQLVPGPQKGKHIAAVRKEGLAGYTIRPKGERDLYAPVVYIEPFSKVNSQVLGYDTYFDRTRREPMERARDLDEASISGKVELIQKFSADQSPGFVMFLPIYLNNLPHNSVIDRRKNLVGWVYAAFLVEEMMQSILGKQPDDIDIEIYDGVNLSDSFLMFDHDKIRRNKLASNSRFHSTKQIEINGHTWTILVSSLPAFEARLDDNKPQLVAYSGIGISLLLALLVWLLVSRTNALQAIHGINKELILSEQRWKFALEGPGDGVWDWNFETDEVHFSKRWIEMLGFASDEIEGTLEEWTKRIHPDDIARVMTNMQFYRGGKISSYLNEHRVQCKDGSWKWILSRGMIVSRSDNGSPLRMIGTHTDITKLKESEELVWRQANFDNLTGLPNRHMFYERLEQEIKKAHRAKTPLALLFLDLDQFKEVNDTLGHDKGDLLLKAAAERLTRCVRATDTVARLGGDEFIIILSGLHNSESVERVAQEILARLSEPFKLNNELAYVSASLGITLYPEDGTKIEDLIKNVDQAMYSAKNQGRNRYSYFTPSMQLMAQTRMQLANDMRTALTEDQFRVVYQPIVDLATGTILKAEALIRWQHPTRGLINPVEFIPVAEATGLIVDIGDWVFRQAAHQVKDWRKLHHNDFQISINKSPVQFHNDQNSHMPWFEYLQKLGLPGQSIVVEITEGILLDASESVTQILLQFKDAGIQVSLDDFGTGYSSLSYLKKFDIDYIKIDQSFVANLAPSSDDMALCEAIIVMSHKLGIKVIAEGVETTEQRDLLVAAGCDFGQGFLFSKPVSAKEFEKLF